MGVPRAVEHPLGHKNSAPSNLYWRAPAGLSNRMLWSERSRPPSLPTSQLYPRLVQQEHRPAEGGISMLGLWGSTDLGGGNI
jgi:hypothetical protein